MVTSRFAVLDEKLAAALPPSCKLCAWLAAADKHDADYVARMLADTTKSGAHIARVLTEGGVAISETSVRRHRTHTSQ